MTGSEIGQQLVPDLLTGRTPPPMAEISSGSTPPTQAMPWTRQGGDAGWGGRGWSHCPLVLGELNPPPGPEGPGQQRARPHAEHGAQRADAVVRVQRREAVPDEDRGVARVDAVQRAAAGRRWRGAGGWGPRGLNPMFVSRQLHL